MLDYTLYYGAKEVSYVGDKGLRYLSKKLVKLVSSGHGFRLVNNRTGETIRIPRASKPMLK